MAYDDASPTAQPARNWASASGVRPTEKKSSWVVLEPSSLAAYVRVLITSPAEEGQASATAATMAASRSVSAAVESRLVELKQTEKMAE